MTAFILNTCQVFPALPIDHFSELQKESTSILPYFLVDCSGLMQGKWGVTQIGRWSKLIKWFCSYCKYKSGAIRPLKARLLFDQFGILHVSCRTHQVFQWNILWKQIYPLKHSTLCSVLISQTVDFHGDKWRKTTTFVNSNVHSSPEKHEVPSPN